MKYAHKWSSFIYHVLDDYVPGLHGSSLCGKSFDGDEMDAVEFPHYYRICKRCRAMSTVPGAVASER